MFTFLTRRPLWVNFLAAIAFAALIIFGFLQLLGLITNHGQYLVVPSVIGKSKTEAVKFLESKGFDVVIQDSFYVDTAKKGIVLKQLPDPNSTVKINRTVFLTVNRLTLPDIEMPSLIGKTLNFAILILERSHLKLGDTTHKPDFMQGSVLGQVFNGDNIMPGAKLPWGSSVDLVIAGGLTEERIPVPSLLGLTMEEAKILLESYGISFGAVIPEAGITDTAAAFIYKQKPAELSDEKMRNYIRSGQLMDIWISPVMKVMDSTIVY